MSELTLANNNFTGNLYNMPKNLFFVETANNENLCGMVSLACTPCEQRTENLLSGALQILRILQPTSKSCNICA